MFEHSRSLPYFPYFIRSHDQEQDLNLWRRRHSVDAMPLPVERDDLPPVLWLGGGSGAGKTTVSRTLAHRYDLAWYRIDAHAYAHQARLRGGAGAPAGGYDERWLAPAPEQLAREFLDVSARVFPLIIEDLRAMPERVAVVVEGPQLFPSLVAPYLTSPDRARWLVPTEEFQRAALATRAGSAAQFTSDPERALANLVARNQLLNAHTRQVTAEQGLTVVEVDGSRDLPTTVELVGKHFAAAIAEGPSARDGHQRHRLRRSENAAMVAGVRAFLADLGEAAPTEPPPLGFACECVQLGCEALVHQKLASTDGLEDGRGQSAVAPGHRIE